jgi:hypothetical protein
VEIELHCISQSAVSNLFLPADVHKRELHKIHFDAWKKGLKSLYYCRSKSIQRAENINDSKSTDLLANVYKNKATKTEEPEYESAYHVSSRKNRFQKLFNLKKKKLFNQKKWDC